MFSELYRKPKTVIMTIVLVSLIGLVLSLFIFPNQVGLFGYGTYEGNDFSFKYPRLWTAPTLNISENKGTIKVGGEDGDLGGIWIMWYNEGNDVDFKSYNEFLDYQFDSLAEYYEGDNWISLDYREAFIIDGHEGLIQFIDTSKDGEQLRTMMAIWHCNETNRRISLTISTLPNNHAKITNTIIKDFKCH